jgi:hypothetical protein
MMISILLSLPLRQSNDYKLDFYLVSPRVNSGSHLIGFV